MAAEAAEVGQLWLEEEKRGAGYGAFASRLVVVVADSLLSNCLVLSRYATAMTARVIRLHAEKRTRSPLVHRSEAPRRAEKRRLAWYESQWLFFSAVLLVLRPLGVRIGRGTASACLCRVRSFSLSSVVTLCLVCRGDRSCRIVSIAGS